MSDHLTLLTDVAMEKAGITWSANELASGVECIMCGASLKRDVKKQDGPYVHYLWTGRITTLPEHPESQGLLEVGITCANKLKKIDPRLIF